MAWWARGRSKARRGVNLPCVRYRAGVSRGPRAVRAAIVAALCCALPGLVACRDDAVREAAGTEGQYTHVVRGTHRTAEHKVLLVHSYDTSYPWVDAITQGVRRAFSGEPIELQIYYMDTKRQTDAAWKTAAGQKAQAIVTEWQPDAVIAADDNAQEFFARQYVGQTTPQFVFCGVNEELDRYGYPAKNITGILERPHMVETVALLQLLCPDVQRIAVISDDSPTSVGALRYIRRCKLDSCEIVLCETPRTLAEWQDAVRRSQAVADAIAIYTYHTVQRTEDAPPLPPKELMGWTVDNSHVPVVGFFSFAIDDGALCGYLESGVEHGLRAGEMTLQILDGARAGDLPVVTALDGQSVLNLTTARKLGLTVPAALLRETDILVGE